MPRTVEIKATLRLKVFSPGERNNRYVAELFVSGKDKFDIQNLILATGIDAVSIKNRRDL